MTAERWQIVKARFTDCLSMAPERREAFLADEGVPDDVRNEVSRLLRNLDQAGSRFLDPPDAVRQAFSPPGPLLNPGEVLAERFQIHRLIGNGGMGEVYEALDKELDCSIAIKILRPFGNVPLESSARFRRELLLARRVTHPNVCRLFDINRHNLPSGEVEFLTMELLRGETLAELIRKSGKIGQDKVESILRGILFGLQAVHSAGIVHRDLKPGNVMVVQDDSDSFQITLMDFGLALMGGDESLATSLTATGNVLGTLAYISPEQLSGEPVTPAADCYAFGLIWFEMLTGERVHGPQTNIAHALMRLQKPVALSSSPLIPARWMNSIRSCLSLDPAHRPSVHELLRDLNLSGISRRPGRDIKRQFRFRRREILAGTASIVFFAGCVSLFQFRSRLFRQSVALPEGSTALLVPIVNLTGDASLDAATELLRNQLTQSVHLNLIDRAGLSAALRQMGKASNPGAVEMREAGWRLNSALMIFGSISRVGNDYVLNIQMETRGPEPSIPRAKVPQSFPAPDTVGLMRAVHNASVWIRENAGERARNIATFDRLPSDVTTPSWEALTFYARSEQLSVQHRFEDALLMLDSALQRDPQFTLAAVRRADLLMNRFRQKEGLLQWRAAMRMLNARPITRSEELHARGMFAFDSGDFASADKNFATWALEYPNDPRPLIYRAVPLILDGHAGEARTILERAAQINVAGTSVFLQLVNSSLVLGDARSARNWIARFRKPGDTERADLKEAATRYRELDFVGAMRIFVKLRESAGPRNAAAAALQEGMLLIEAEQFARSAETLERFLAKTSRAEEDPERAVLWAVLGWAYLRGGRSDVAVHAATKAMNFQSGYVVLMNAGTIMPRAGALKEAHDVLRQCAEFQDMPAYRITSLRIHGEILRRQGRRAEALTTLKEASELEPRLAYREYMIEALDTSDPMRIELSRRVVTSPWLFFRDLTIDAPGILATAVRILLKANPKDPDSLAMSKSLHAVSTDL